jgi:hypothetical protein
MKNEFFFQIDISEEQILLANKLVDYSIANHPVKDIFAKDPEGKERQREFRFTGTIGEIVFADAYGLPRPTRSFGAIDGQDFGQDFVLEINGQPKSFDVKSMGRKNNNFRTNYVLNLPAYQMRRESVVTDYYFCISIHKLNAKFIASFLGYVSKNEIETNAVGTLYKAGSRRMKDDGGSFSFQRDTFEVDFNDICSPQMNNQIQETTGFLRKSLLPPFQKNERY